MPRSDAAHLRDRTYTVSRGDKTSGLEDSGREGTATCGRGGAATWEESGMEGTALWEVRLDIYLWTIDKIEIHIRGQGQTHTWEDCDGT